MVFYVQKNKVYDFCIRTAVYSFLIEYKEYIFFGHMKDNVFVAKYKGRKVIVSLFMKSEENINSLKLNTDIREVHIFFWYSDKKLEKSTDYERNNYFKSDFEARISSKNKDILLSTSRDIEDEKLVRKLFGPYLNMKLKGNRLFYKYKGCDGCRVQEMLNGEITYSNSFTFNDPFDCDFSEYLHGDEMTNLKNKFRVLCLSPKYDDILMWGYYGGSHDGICVGHTLNDIFSSTIKKYSGIIIYGNVNYSFERPDYFDKSPLLISFLPYFYAFSKLVQCCFTKYIKWKHESEFRIVTLVDGFDEDVRINEKEIKDFINIEANTSVVYKGCKYAGKDKNGKLIYFNNPSLVSELVEDEKVYKLNVR